MSLGKKKENALQCVHARKEVSQTAATLVEFSLARIRTVQIKALKSPPLV